MTRLDNSIQTESQSSVRSLLQANYQTSTKTSKSYPYIRVQSLRLTLTSSELFRYLVPNDLTAYKFSYIIRKRIKMPEKDSLYFFVNGRYVLKGDTLMSEVYE